MTLEKAMNIAVGCIMASGLSQKEKFEVIETLREAERKLNIEGKSMYVMKDIGMACESQDCVCDDWCCQECSKAQHCEQKCGAMKYKEKIYSSDEFLIEELYKLAEQEDSWLVEVAAEKIKALVS